MKNFTIALPNSRTFESEADVMGIEIAARAGYDPRAAATLWKKMGSITKFLIFSDRNFGVRYYK